MCQIYIHVKTAPAGRIFARVVTVVCATKKTTQQTAFRIKNALDLKKKQEEGDATYIGFRDTRGMFRIVESRVSWYAWHVRKLASSFPFDMALVER